MAASQAWNLLNNRVEELRRQAESRDNYAEHLESQARQDRDAATECREEADRISRIASVVWFLEDWGISK